MVLSLEVLHDESGGLKSRQSLDTMTAAVESLLLSEDTAAAPLVNAAAVLLVTQGAAGDAFLSFLQQRPNHWSHAACHSCTFSREVNAEQQLQENATGPTDAAATSLQRYFAPRSMLLQRSATDGADGSARNDKLQMNLRDAYGFQRIEEQVLSSHERAEHVDATAEWWARKLQR